MRAGYFVTGTVTALVAIWMISSGLRQWHHAGRPVSYWLRTGMFDDHARAGYDRAAVVLGIGSAFLTVILGIGAVAGPPRRGNGIAEIALGVTAIIGIFVCAVLFNTIFYFNRPRSLVPPDLRGQPGALAGRRHDRQERREHAEHHSGRK